MMTEKTKKSKGGRPVTDLELCREVIHRMDQDAAWDQIQAKDVDPKVMDYVREELSRGVEAGNIAKALGFWHGTADRRWKKIQACIRMGFRADAEAYLYMQSRKLFQVAEKAREVLDDAFEEGVPVVVEIKVKGSTVGHEVMHVKGATKELAGFLKAYTEAIATPVRLWKEYGAIGEKKDAGSTQPTIIVQNNIPMPSAEAILKHTQEMEAKAKAIETTARKINDES